MEIESNRMEWRLELRLGWEIGVEIQVASTWIETEWIGADRTGA